MALFSPLLHWFGDVRIGLAFLSRLPGPAVFDPARIGRIPAVCPEIGLVIGALCVGPAWLFDLALHRPTIAALLAVCLRLWFTRALHEDGLADLADGLGSNETGERFWEIVKDSRTGVFGAVAISLSLIAETLLIAELFSMGLCAAVLCAPLVGRTAIPLIARLGTGLARPGLAAAFLSGATGFDLAAALVKTGVALFLFVPPPAALGLLAGLAPAFWILRVAGRMGGLNGDFLGAGVRLAELAALLCALVFTGVR